MTCTKTHNEDGFERLPDSQAGEQRHKCCGCAYEKGLTDGYAGRPNQPNLNTLDESQAGGGRHKDAKEAYILGYNKGCSIR